MMTQHMARKYWRNLPEAELIPQLVSQARGRTEAMVKADPSQPSHRATRIVARRETETGPAHRGRWPRWRPARGIVAAARSGATRPKP